VEYFVSYYDYYQPEAYIPQSNTYIAKDASVNDAIDQMRHAATTALLQQDDVLIVSSVSCIYGLGSPEVYHEMVVFLEEGMEIRREKILAKLVEIQYARDDIDFHRGTFRAFRDKDINWLERLRGRKQFFLEDLADALGYSDLNWKGPSWSCFYHAALNQRPVSVITARGHSPRTIKDGVKMLVRENHLPQMPNFLSIYPVSNPEIRRELGDADFALSVAALKKRAIRASVQKAVDLYGMNPFHRFGMSDDDPHNIELIAEEMRELKAEFPLMSFFVIETQQGRFVKWEVYADRLEPTLCAPSQDVGAFEQLQLFQG